MMVSVSETSVSYAFVLFLGRGFTDPSLSFRMIVWYNVSYTP